MEPIDSVNEKDAEKDFRNERPKEKRISLYITPKREKLLKDLCSYVGAETSRVDDNDGNLIWDLLEWMEPTLRFRNKLIQVAREAGLKDTDLK